MPDVTPLSEREKEILTLVALGMTNREIAQDLTISPNTVKVHLSNIFEKIGVASRTEATVYAIEHRIVDVPGGEPASEQGRQSSRVFLKQFIWVWVAIILLVAVLLFTFLFNILNENTKIENGISLPELERWQEISIMPEPRTGMAAVAYDGNVYIVAGEGPEGVSGKVFLYSLEEKTWTMLSPKPVPVTDMGGVVIGEKIYIPGGITKEGSPTNILEIYDPRRDKWETGSPLPKSISGYALTNFEGNLYLFGGWDGDQAQDNVYIYDPILNYWYEGAPLPSPRSHLGTVALKEKIIVMGGNDGEEIYNQTWAYYPSRDANDEDPWEVYIDMPEGRTDFGVASIYDSIYILGGISDQQKNDSQEEWVLIGDNWVALPVNQDYSQRQVKLVPVGSLLIIIDPSESLIETRLWSYEAFYYSVYIPITQ